MAGWVGCAGVLLDVRASGLSRWCAVGEAGRACAGGAAVLVLWGYWTYVLPGEVVGVL